LKRKTTISDLKWHKPTWCPGCGDHGLLAALKQAIIRLELDPKDIVVVSGIGCSSKMTDYIKSYGFHTLHGRPIPVATAIKLANPDLTVIVTTGDGDGYAIGMGHFIHAARRNIDITVLIMNNQVYGLTKGQYSPTAEMNFVSGTTPKGSPDQPIDGVALALSAGASFIARSFSGNMKQTSLLIEEAIKHKGFSLLDDLSPCVTFNKVNTYEWFKENIENIEDDESYDNSNTSSAFAKAKETAKIPVGLIYKDEKPSYDDLVLDKNRGPLVFDNIPISQNEFEKIIAKFKY
jgi:2-oxoglutarate ferredoxin oxidoreductase subunit beta